MKIPLFYTLFVIYLVNNIQCIHAQNQHQPTSYSSSNIQTQYRQIDNYINSNVAPQQQQQPQSNQDPSLFQNIDNSQYSQYQLAPSSENYYQGANSPQVKQQDNYNNQQPQLFYVKDDKSLPQVQEQPQRNAVEYLSRQQSENILGNNVPSNHYQQAQYYPEQVQQNPGSQTIQYQQEQHYPEPIQQNPGSQTIQSQADLTPAQQQTLPVEQYQQYSNQPEAVVNPVAYQPLPEQTYQQQLPQNIPQQYNYEALQEKPSQTGNYPAYQQVLVHNEAPPKPKQSSGYKVRETPVERQTEEFSPTNDPFAGHQIVRNSQVFHDLAVHGSFSHDGNIFGQLNYPNQQLGRGQVQQLSQNTYDVFSDSIQGQQNMGLSAYSTADGTPQQRLLNSGL